MILEYLGVFFFFSLVKRLSFLETYTKHSKEANPSKEAKKKSFLSSAQQKRIAQSKFGVTIRVGKPTSRILQNSFSFPTP